jgi:hypothetical protein
MAGLQLRLYRIDAFAIALDSVIGVGSFAVTVSACWYTYLSWQDIVLLAEELYEPRRPTRRADRHRGLTMAIYLMVHFAVCARRRPGAHGVLPAPIIAGYVLDSIRLTLLTMLTLWLTLGARAGYPAPPGQRTGAPEQAWPTSARRDSGEVLAGRAPVISSPPIMATPALEVAVTNRSRRLRKGGGPGGVAERRSTSPGSPSTVRPRSGRVPRSTISC